jgi:hypothetical protein
VLLDRFMPEWQWDEHHAVEIAAPPEATWRALQSCDFRRSRVIDGLLRLRGLPTRARTLAGLADMFTVLGEQPGQEIVWGLVGQFWRPSAGVRATQPSEFASFAEPGFVKTAWNFHLAPLDGARTRLSTTTRVLPTDGYARRRFRLYWLLVRPFSGLIRREMLRLVKASL